MSRTNVTKRVAPNSVGLNQLAEACVLDRPLVRIPASAATRDGFNAWLAMDARSDSVRPSYLNGMICVRHDSGLPLFEIPARAVATLEGFCDWIASDSGPRRGRFSYLNGEVVADMSPEEIETHVKVKGAVNLAVGNLNENEDLGQFYPDGAHLTNAEAGLSTEADATFVSWNSLKTRRVRLIPRKGQRGQYMRIEGSPDWMLEIISRWTARKDLKEMRQKYHHARICEFWIVDAQGEEIFFQILVWRRQGFVAVRPVNGWHRSRIFGRSFRLTRKRQRMGFWQYKLEVRPE
jgi:Uma2 family endonuclease